MTKKKLASKWTWIAGVALLGAGVWMSTSASATTSATTLPGGAEVAERVARGKYLVDAIGCADCHTPLLNGPNGPMRDPNHHLAGHPAQLVMPAAPELPEGPWAFLSAG